MTWKERTCLAVGVSAYKRAVFISEMDGLSPTCTYRDHPNWPVWVGINWLKKNLTDEQFAEYIAEKLLR